MVKIHLCLTLWIFSTLNWPFTIARLRKGDSSDHEHVHIKVHVPEVLRKHTHQHYKTQRLTHPHFVKRFPLHYGNVDVDDDEYDTHAIFEPYDLVQPAPLPLLTSEHEFVAHMGAAGLPLANNDIINNNLGKKQQQKQSLQPQIRLPAIIPPAPLSLPMTVPIPMTMPMPATQALYATEAADSFATHSNINNYEPHDDDDDDILTDLQKHQQLYANNNNNNYNTLTSTLLSAANVSKKKKKQQNQKREKKRKRITIANNNNNNFKDNSHKYYVNEQQEEEYAPQLRQAFQPYISTNQPYGNSYGNTYKNNIYSNEDSSNYGKKYKLSSIVPSFAATFDAPTDADADVENSSEEEQDINEDVDSAFKASFQQPTESASVEHYHHQQQQQQQQHPGKSLTQAFGGSTGNGNGFSPVSYQQLFATYAATPATNHLSTQPTTRIKFKRQHPIQQQQQPHSKQIRQQFVQLSSMAPIVAADIDGFHSTVLAPITTNKIYEPMSSIAHIQQPTKRIKQRYIKRKNRIKVKRNRL